MESAGVGILERGKTASIKCLNKVSEEVEEKKNWLLIMISVLFLTITHFFGEKDNCQID